MRKRASPVVATLLVIGLSVACGSRDTPTSPTTQTITLGSDSTSAPLDASIPIVAIVRAAGGVPVDGAVVQFATTFGVLSLAEVPTRNGVAITMLATGSLPGTAQVSASVGTETATPIRITIAGGATASSLMFSERFYLLPSTGGAVEITANAVTGEGVQAKPLQGVLVLFSTTAGTLAAAAATTDHLGRATTTLTTTATATVSARIAGATDGPLVHTTEVRIRAVPTITLTVSPVSALVGEPITATLVARVPAGDPPPGAMIAWGDGLTTLAGRGVDTTQRHGYALPGEYLIVGTATGAPGETASTEPVRVTIGPQTRVGLVYEFSSSGFSGQMHTFMVFPRLAANPSAVRIEYGDGTSAAIDPSAARTRVTKRYALRGPYTVRVVQTNADGTTETASVDIVSLCCG